MADKTISELPAATNINPADLFVLQQQATNQACSMQGQVLLNFLTDAADGHGGVSNFELVSTQGRVKTYRFTMADTTTYEFSVSDGATGATGAQTYVWIKWAAQNPTADIQLSNNPDKWIGIYVGLSSSAPAAYTAYTWYEYKGEKGDTGDTGTSVSNIVWTSNSGGQAQGTAGTSDTYTVNLSNGTTAGTFVVRNGNNGTGAVNTVNSILPDSSGNVLLTATDVGAASFTDTTNGYWKIRRWANGTVEAWYSHQESFSCTVAYGGFYINGVNTVTVSVPNIFANIEMCIVGGYGGTNGYAGMVAFAASVSGSIPILCLSSVSGTIAATVNVYMRGTSA